MSVQTSRADRPRADRRRADGHGTVEHRTVDGPCEPEPEQLELLPAAGVPVRYQLSQRTRRIGLAGVAKARALLAEQAARRHEADDEAGHLAPPYAA